MKKYFLFAVVILINWNADLYGQNWVWEKSAGTGGGFGRSVGVDAGGNSFVTGSLYNPNIAFGATTLTNVGSSIVFVAKYGPSGNPLWAKGAGGTDNNGGNSICADSSGNAYVTGYFINTPITFGTTTLTNAGNGDAFLVKYDSNGNVVWGRSIGASGMETGYCASIDGGGNIILTGSFSSSTVTIGSVTLTNSDPSGNTFDAFVAKYNASGSLLWAKSIAGINSDYGRSVCADIGGNVFVTGYFNSPTITTGPTTLTNTASGTNDIFIVKYDANGNVLWAKNVGGTGDDAGASVSAAGGNVFITGGFSSSSISLGSNTLTNASTGTNDVFIAKYDANGNILWAHRAGASGDDSGICLSSDASGNVFVTGGFSYSAPSITFGTTTLIPPIYSGCIGGPCDPMFIVKYDPNGNVICGSSLQSGGDQGNGGDRNAVCAGPLGSGFVTSSFDASYFILGADTLHTTINDEFFIAKYNCANSVGMKELNSEEMVSVYPNPTTGIFLINLKNKTLGTQFCVRDILGNTVSVKVSQKNNCQEIDLSGQPKGIYFMEIMSGTERILKKIVVQ